MAQAGHNINQKTQGSNVAFFKVSVAGVASTFTTLPRLFEMRTPILQQLGKYSRLTILALILIPEYTHMRVMRKPLPMRNLLERRSR